MLKTALIVALSCSATFLDASAAGPETVIEPFQFGSTYKSTNLPDGPVWAIQPWDAMFLVQGGTNTHRGYMLFDLSAIPADATITAVHFDFYQQLSFGNPVVEVRGGYEPGELAYDTYTTAPDSVHPGQQVHPDAALFTSMIDDSQLFGGLQIAPEDNGQVQSIPLNGDGVLEYFQNRIGGQVLLTTRLADDLTNPNGWHGDETIDDGYPALRFEFAGGSCPADLDEDGLVGPADLAALLAAWGPGEDTPEDLDGNGSVGPEDLASMLAAWGPCSG